MDFAILEIGDGKCGPPLPQIRLADPSHGGIIPLAQLRTHARTHARNASAIEIDFPVGGSFSHEELTPPTSELDYVDLGLYNCQINGLKLALIY